MYHRFFGELDIYQPIQYEQIQWLLTHPHPFTADNFAMIDQQVAELDDHDTVDTHTQADWERFKQAKRTKWIK